MPREKCVRGRKKKDFSGAVPRLVLVKDACLSRALEQHLPGLSATKKHVSVLMSYGECGQRSTTAMLSKDKDMHRHAKIMGDFKGHALPGFFLITLGIWWTTKCVLKYAFKKQKRTSYYDSKALFCRIDLLEGIVLAGMALIGILGGQFVPGGPHLILYDYKKDQWVRLLDWHHFTMYLFFGLLGVTSILCSTIRSLPASFNKLMLLNALFVEAFVFYNHTHGREMLDVFVHKLLVLVICFTGLIAFLELFIQAKITVELLRTSLFLLQGSWFWQIGFVLYPFNGGPPWDLMDHDNIMFLTICFCWHYATAIIITGATYAFVTWLVKSRFTRFCPSEVELLKNAEREQDSEEEM